MRKIQVEVTVEGDINKALYILRNKFNKEGLKKMRLPKTVFMKNRVKLEDGKP